MAWSTPRTWTAGELVTATMMNGHVRDQFTYLKLSPTFDGDVQVASGLVVGYAGTPAAAQVRVGDSAFGMIFNAGNPYVQFDGGDYYQYTRTSNRWDWYVGFAAAATLNASGLQVLSGLVVGFAGTPAAATVEVGDANFLLDFNAGGGLPRITFDSGDYLFYDRTNNNYDWRVGSNPQMTLSGSLLRVNNDVEFAATGVGKNAALFGVGSFGGGQNVVFIANRLTAPTSNPTGGGLMYSAGGAGTWRGSGGTITTFGPAEPHCPRCGRDCAIEHENAEQKWHQAICFWCLAVVLDKLGVKPEEYAIPPSPEQLARLGAGAVTLASPKAPYVLSQYSKGPATTLTSAMIGAK